MRSPALTLAGLVGTGLALAALLASLATGCARRHDTPNEPAAPAVPAPTAVLAPTASETAAEIEIALARATFHRHCGECHDSRNATAKPEALLVFDLVDDRWLDRLSPAQIESAKGRLKGKATDGEQQATFALLDTRAQEGRLKATQN